LVTPEAIARAREEWGERNDLWQVRVLGQFPQGSASQLIRLEWVEAAARIRKGDAGAECSPVAGTNPESPKDLCALGVNGTAAASHADVSDIAIVRHPAPVVEACVVLAGRAWRRKDLQFVVNPTAGGPGALPLAEVDPEARALLGPYRRVAFGAI
jgi:hypothetical protein